MVAFSFAIFICTNLRSHSVKIQKRRQRSRNMHLKEKAMMWIVIYVQKMVANQPFKLATSISWSLSIHHKYFILKVGGECSHRRTIRLSSTSHTFFVCDNQTPSPVEGHWMETRRRNTFRSFSCVLSWKNEENL